MAGPSAPSPLHPTRAALFAIAARLAIAIAILLAIAPADPAHTGARGSAFSATTAEVGLPAATQRIGAGAVLTPIPPRDDPPVDPPRALSIVAAFDGGAAQNRPARSRSDAATAALRPFAGPAPLGARAPPFA